MFRLTNKNTNIDLTDEYGHVIEFHYEHTAKEYYSNHCQGMCQVIIKEDLNNLDKVVKPNEIV